MLDGIRDIQRGRFDSARPVAGDQQILVFPVTQLPGQPVNGGHRTLFVAGRVQAHGEADGAPPQVGFQVEIAGGVGDGEVVGQPVAGHQGVDVVVDPGLGVFLVLSAQRDRDPLADAGAQGQRQVAAELVPVGDGGFQESDPFPVAGVDHQQSVRPGQGGACVLGFFEADFGHRRQAGPLAGRRADFF